MAWEKLEQLEGGEQVFFEELNDFRGKYKVPVKYSM